MAVWATLLWTDTNLWSLCLLVQQFAQALNPVPHKKGTFCCFFKCLGFYCVQISKWTAWVLTNAAACSQGKSPFIYRLFKDKKKLYLYNPPAHSLTNSYLPQPCFRRTIYETLKENTQLSHRLLAGRSCDATGFWRWQNCKRIKKDFFFPAPSVWWDVCPGGYSGHLAGTGWEQTVLAAVCARHPLV